VDTGPINLVQAGLIEQIKELGWQVEFGGHHQFEDIKADTNQEVGIVKRPRLVSRVTKEVATVIGGHAKAGRLPLTLGGDHSLALGTVSGTLE
jgi:arginase